MDHTAEHPAVTIKNLSWSYDAHTILTDISALIQRNSFTSILGPNGSGKTTLIKEILRILPVEQHTVYIEQEDITQLDRKTLATRLGLVPQNERNPYQFSVEDMIRLGRYAHGKQPQHTDEYILERVMQLTSIAHLRDHLITELSGGEYQRVIIARALAQEPGILVLDEPTTYLDPHHQLEILRLLSMLIRQEGLTVVCILHDLNSAMSFSDSVILLHEGHVYGHGSPEEMLQPDILKEVYGIHTRIITDPFTGNPYIIPDTRH